MDDYSIMIYTPTEFNEVIDMTVNLRKGKALIINLNYMDEGRQRVVDFMAGAAFSINGTTKRIDEGIILCTPRNLAFQVYPSCDEEEVEE